MSNKQLVIELPEELIAQATAAQINIRAVVEQALLTELHRTAPVAGDESEQWGTEPLTLEQKETKLRQLLPPERLPEGLKLLHEGRPIPGLHGGKLWISEDFDVPLSDETWDDLFA